MVEDYDGITIRSGATWVDDTSPTHFYMPLYNYNQGLKEDFTYLTNQLHDQGLNEDYQLGKSLSIMIKAYNDVYLVRGVTIIRFKQVLSCLKQKCLNNYFLSNHSCNV